MLGVLPLEYLAEKWTILFLSASRKLFALSSTCLKEVLLGAILIQYAAPVKPGRIQATYGR